MHIRVQKNIIALKVHSGKINISYGFELRSGIGRKVDLSSAIAFLQKTANVPFSSYCCNSVNPRRTKECIFCLYSAHFATYSFRVEEISETKTMTRKRKTVFTSNWLVSTLDVNEPLSLIELLWDKVLNRLHPFMALTWSPLPIISSSLSSLIIRTRTRTLTSEDSTKINQITCMTNLSGIILDFTWC